MTYATEFLEKGLPRPALLALKSDQVIQYDLAGLVDPGQSLMGPMLAAVAGQEGVECVALVGTLRMRRKKGQPGLPSIAVYIEWPDNRWVMRWLALGPERKVLGDGPIYRSAVEGWPRPSGLGGWFAQSRRTGLRLKVTPAGAAAQVH